MQAIVEEAKKSGKSKNPLRSGADKQKESSFHQTANIRDYSEPHYQCRSLHRGRDHHHSYRQDNIPIPTRP
jgi:hypothetical protein